MEPRAEIKSEDYKIKVKVKPNLDKDKGLKGLDWN